MFNIVLITPQIPQNTGAIGRMCVNTDCKLHIIKPTIFSLDDKSVRRAGLDYWKKLNPIIWENLEDFYEKNQNSRMFVATTKTDKLYYDFEFLPDDFLIFGSESNGTPKWFMDKISPNLMTIPMSKNGRSLNLAMSVGIVTYEAIRQNLSKFKDII